MNYKELVNDFTPRYINEEDEYKSHIKRLDEILDILIDREHTEDESDYMHLLGMVIYEYEEQFEEEMEVVEESPFEQFKVDGGLFLGDCTILYGKTGTGKGFNG